MSTPILEMGESGIWEIGADAAIINVNFEQDVVI
jgi:hypothetical protein